MPGRPLSGFRVLVVEDEYLLADELARALAQDGAEVVGPAPTVRQALELLRAEARIDGAVLDVNLGDEKVFAVAEALEGRNIPFVFTTGYERLALPTRYRDVVRCEKPVNVGAVGRAIGRRISG